MGEVPSEGSPVQVHHDRLALPTPLRPVHATEEAGGGGGDVGKKCLAERCRAGRGRAGLTGLAKGCLLPSWCTV